VKVNQDAGTNPQNETTIALNPLNRLLKNSVFL
jgi:hypothetical protein